MFFNTCNHHYLPIIANIIRQDVIKMIFLAGDGHPAPALSAVDIITTLYFKVMYVDPKNPNRPDRDRFILSKGHACPAYYAALARRGYFPVEWLPTLRRLGSPLQGHPDMKKTPGVDMTTGSLGHGIAIGAGMAAAAKLIGYKYRVFVLTGDGELNEGINWEAAQSASHLKLSNLIVIVDNNGWQSSGPIKLVSGLDNICSLFQAFGWKTLEIDGHDFSQIFEAIQIATDSKDRPTVIRAYTVKGKGVPFMEGDNSWHKRVPSPEEFKQAISYLESEKARLERLATSTQKP